MDFVTSDMVSPWLIRNHISMHFRILQCGPSRAVQGDIVTFDVVNVRHCQFDVINVRTTAFILMVRAKRTAKNEKPRTAQRPSGSHLHWL
jgi:hypothetical protein